MAPRHASQALGSMPVGASEIAERLGVRPQTVHAWRHRGLLPEPAWTVSGHPAWDWTTIEAWARDTGRLAENTSHADLLALEGTGWDGDLDAMRATRVLRK